MRLCGVPDSGLRRIAQESIACGDCYRYAFQRMVDDVPAPGKLVHAVVHPSWHPRSYEHAWYEKDGRAYDWQSMVGYHAKGSDIYVPSEYQGEGWPVEDFYAAFRPTDIREYGMEAVGIAALSGNYGPWTTAEESLVEDQEEWSEEEMKREEEELRRWMERNNR